MPIAGKWVKIFKKQINEEPYVVLDKPDTKEQSNNNHEGAESELALIIDIGEEAKGASDEEE